VVRVKAGTNHAQVYRFDDPNKMPLQTPSTTDTPRCSAVLTRCATPGTLAAMHEISWLDKHVPGELRMALGDLVIVAAGVESSTYGIARIYRVPDPQLHSAKRIIGKLEARVGNLGIPPWADVERKKLLAWSHAARLLLQERDLLVHASISIGSKRLDGK